ncbi:hypothetical protein FRC17_000837, partial [Serendipita sp. 399]
MINIDWNDIEANQRCGAWYTDPKRARSEFVYFKSTDGHYGVWDFNLRRANLHLLPIIQAYGGILLVDSTRRGKSIPDALSKTVPLWCAVINGAQIYRRNRQLAEVDIELMDQERRRDASASWEEHGRRIFVPSEVISESERAQMEARLPELVNKFVNSSFFSHLPHLQWPLRPFWITPQTTTFPAFSSLSPPTAVQPICTPSEPDIEGWFYPVICLSASKISTSNTEQTLDKASSYNYVQGSGDDHESWSKGMTPDLFWKYRDQLIACDRDDLEEFIQRIEVPAVSSDQIPPVSDLSSPPPRMESEITVPIDAVNGWIAFAASNPSISSPKQLCSAVILIRPCNAASQSRTGVETIDEANGTKLIITSMGAKKGQMDLLHIILPAADKFARMWCARTAQVNSRDSSIVSLGSERQTLLVVDETRECDEAIGVIMLILGLLFDDDGRRLVYGKTNKVTKGSLRKRLEWIQQSIPRANPSRTTMKRVNEYAITGKSGTRRQRP